MKGMYRILAVVVALVTLWGCGKKAEEVEKVESSPAREEKVEPARPQGKILARVNGVPISEGDLFPLGAPSFPPRMGEEEKREMMDSLLQNAIEQEVLYQEARRMGLEKDRDYRESLKQRERQVELDKVESLARFYENSIPELKEAKDPKAISEEEVEQYYQEHERRYARMSEEKARRFIRNILARQRYGKVYKEWLRKRLSGAELKVNGKSLSSQGLLDSLGTMFPSPGARPPRSGVSPLEEEAREIIIGEEAKRRNVSKEEVEKDEKLVQELWSKALFKVNGKEFVVSDTFMPAFHSPHLFHLVKNYLVASEAEKKGIHKDPQYLAQKERMRGPLGGPREGKKFLLISTLLKKKGIYNFRNIEVSQAEIDAYYQQHIRRYQRMGKQRAETSIRRMLQSQKSNQMRKDLVADLRAKAKIKILD